MTRRDRFVTVPLGADGSLTPAASRQLESVAADYWYVFTTPEIRLHPDLPELVQARMLRRPDAGIFYGDEAVAAPERRAGTVAILRKPSFDAAQLIAQDYLGLPLIVSGAALLAIGGAVSEAGSAVTYDIALRAMAAGIAAERITTVLSYHAEAKRFSREADRAGALGRWQQAAGGLNEILPGLIKGSFQLRRRFDSFPAVSLVIPTALKASQGGAYVFALLDSIATTDWPMDRLEVVVGDDGDAAAWPDLARWPFRVIRIDTRRQPGEAFNYAAKMNRLWRDSSAPYLVLMNDDLLIRNADWLQALMTFVMIEDVGGVGARLLYPNDTIQHAGMPAGVLGACTHAFINTPASAPTYQNWAGVHREWSLVTGAVFATRREVLERAGGFDEALSLEFNDIDLCLRLRILGYRIVYTPFAELTHYESATRRNTRRPGSEVARFMQRWQNYLADDPAYHPALTRAASDCAPLPEPQPWWETGAAVSWRERLLGRKRRAA
jgi:hypothetical protein